MSGLPVHASSLLRQEAKLPWQHVPRPEPGNVHLEIELLEFGVNHFFVSSSPKSTPKAVRTFLTCIGGACNHCPS
ncbi:hypothetical protein SAMN06265222_10512 [Neorhodopirellula lusitana]|uniref:Uncharacterized protein n=1 Tax=Neorhodopirellula lusitana TaxID=445327 RepID=A0ABY1Q1M9_9BACT|nr:hypothetical protein SAMN06265222_10512 [Neorhodopirellula lusitana]